MKTKELLEAALRDLTKVTPGTSNPVFGVSLLPPYGHEHTTDRHPHNKEFAHSSDQLQLDQLQTLGSSPMPGSCNAQTQKSRKRRCDSLEANNSTSKQAEDSVEVCGIEDTTSVNNVLAASRAP